MNIRVFFAPSRLCVRFVLVGVFVWAQTLLLRAAEVEKPAEAKPSDPAAAAPYAEPGDESDQYQVETLLSGLDNPCAVVVRPEARDGQPYEIYVSESGAGQVLRVTSDKPSESTPIITGFPVDSYGDAKKAESEYRIGPLGLAFITPKKLAVGGAGLEQGEDLVTVYSLPEDGSALEYKQQDHAVGPIPKGKKTTTGEGNFYGLAKSDDALFVTSNGDDDEAWVLKADLKANKLRDLQPFIATKRLVGTTGPTGAVVNPKQNANYLVISQMSDFETDRDSLITFYSPRSGKVALNQQTGLYDIAGLAYSPTDNLYAVDVVRADAKLGGVYRLDSAEKDGKQTCRAVKIAGAERPTALAFGPDGAMYVTAIGPRQAPGTPSTGVLLKITPKTDAAKF
ncbi:hypothetical protein PLANPX_4906 [Lacipirellula parvula]|uniref:SMP-30/Gluconolactonase/LRE-like region domain-containing protein n=1 Tax=Lacipirellula parvula TaxID=2650471 RepID=A0A5K7XEJ9_9BACT|nr:hypothetical protein PLANPX_4906 [Lacipirellula parvula]